MPDIILPPMSNRSREILYILTANRSEPIWANRPATVIPYQLFIDVSPSLADRKNLNVAVAMVKPVLKMFGFYTTAVSNQGYICHKSILHTPGKFDRKFFGAKKINEEP